MTAKNIMLVVLGMLIGIVVTVAVILVYRYLQDNEIGCSFCKLNGSNLALS